MNIEKRIKGLIKIVPSKDLNFLLKDQNKLAKTRAKVLMRIINDEYTNSVTPSSAEKRMLNRIENQLIEKIGLIGIEKNYSDEFGESATVTYKRYIFILSIYDFGQRSLAIYYAKKLIKQSEERHLYDLNLLLYQFIEHYYSFIVPDMSQSNAYSQKFSSLLDILTTKGNISKLYYELANRVINNKSLITKEEFDSYENKIIGMREQIFPGQASIIIQRVYSNFYFFYLLTGQYEKLKEVANEALSFYQDNLNNIKFQLYMMRLRRAVSCIYTNDFSESRQDFKTLLAQNPRPGTIHWNSTYSYFFTLEMLCKRFQSAANILFDVTSKNVIERLDDIWLQQWRIRSAYIHFLAKIGYVDLSEAGKRRVPNFKLGKFLNEVPHYSKDKRGMNISILIAQFIILLADQKYGKLIDRVEALDKYSYRHLKNDQNLRSNCFIRMLLALVKADFNPIRANRYAEKYVKRLESTEMNLNEYSAEIEVIPYEQLWEIILEITKPLQRGKV